MKKPNFFIIGAPRCGTTALYRYLRTHPQIYMSDPKEPSYFCDDFSPQFRRCTDEKTYLQTYFAGAGEHHKVVGEASAMYLYSKTAVHNIKIFNPGAKLIVLFRDPVEMLYSFHARYVYDFVIEEKDFVASWNLQTVRSQGECLTSRCVEPAFLQYRAVASFGEQLQRVYSYFPRQQVKVIFYDDFNRDPAAVYADVLDFLGVPHDGRHDFPVINANRHHRLDWLGKVLHDMPPSLTRTVAALKKSLGIKTLWVGRLARKFDTAESRREPIPEDMRQKILLELQSDIELLEKLTSRDLSPWKVMQRAESLQD